MTVCKTCNGLGKIKLMPFGYICTCAECKGTGETRDYMTNEEYLKSCTTEQLAEWISKVTIDAWFRQVNNELPKPNGAKEWVEWLKQPHNSPK